MDFGCSSFSWETKDGSHLLGRTYDQFGDLTANRIVSVPPGDTLFAEAPPGGRRYGRTVQLHWYGSAGVW